MMNLVLVLIKSDICKNASKKVGALVRLKNMIPREAKLQLYKLALNFTKLNILSHSVAFLQSV